MKHGNLYWAAPLVWMAGLQQIQAAGDSKQPNIVFILADDLGWTDLGVMGSDYYETPNIDRLASQGLLFDNAYAAAANSAPSRACMMTGMYTPRHGVFTVSPPDRGDRTKRKLIPCPNTDDVRADFVTLAEALQQQAISADISVNGIWGMMPTGQGRCRKASSETLAATVPDLLIRISILIAYRTRANATWDSTKDSRANT